MSDTHDPGGPVPDASELDELASALVDGEATAEEQARAAEPPVAARIADLERVARLVATPVAPADPVVREQAIAAALDAWGTPEPLEARAPAAAARVDDLAAARRRRQGGGLRLLGAAAAVLAVLAAGAVALQGGGDDSDDTATASVEVAEESAGDESAEREAAGSAAEEFGVTTREGILDLGEFDDVDALLDASRGVAAGSSEFEDSSDGGGTDADADAGEGASQPAAGAAPNTTAATEPPEGCLLETEPGFTLLASATVEGRRVVVIGDGERLQVIDVDRCERIAERRL